MNKPAPIDVILVDDQDTPIGLCEKLEAHKSGALHRAISVYLTSTGKIDTNEETLVLLQKRSAQKYHSPNLWSNTACSHPLEWETLQEAAHRALRVELGITLESLTYMGYFIYKTSVSNSHGKDLIEHELDHVFVGKYDPALPIPFSPEEVGQTKWVPYHQILPELKQFPDKFTHWFPYLHQFLQNPKSGKDFRE